MRKREWTNGGDIGNEVEKKMKDERKRNERIKNGKIQWRRNRIKKIKNMKKI